jgi:hypothetical protein
MKFNFNGSPWFNPRTFNQPKPTVLGKQKSGLHRAPFSVFIPQGNHLLTGHVEMRHQAQYTINLTNDAQEQCDAQVVIDGKHVGTWRIPPCSKVEIERPADDDGRFTFYRLHSSDGRRSGLRNDEDLGLITVTFMPEVTQKLYSCDEEPIKIMFSKRAGGTGLSGVSSQRFSTAEYIEHDHAKKEIIHLRLIANDEVSRPLHGLSVKPPLVY